MCTLTFIPRPDGYYLAMNRDEQITRGEASPPTQFQRGSSTAIYPVDVEGGTWIAGCHAGNAFALLNSNDAPNSGPRRKLNSRGLVIPEIVHLHSPEEVHARLPQIGLHDILPFRLIAIWPSVREVYEWRWDASSLRVEQNEWSARRWFSSSLSDEQANTQRGSACRRAWRDTNAGSLAWVRELHRSHAGGPGPFSICVHRKDVRTVSYTELIWSPVKLSFNYVGRSPCEHSIAQPGIRNYALVPPYFILG
jgi:hypothetical protein